VPRRIYGSGWASHREQAGTSISAAPVQAKDVHPETIGPNLPISKVYGPVERAYTVSCPSVT
jgi:hypothetical protein